MIRHLILPVLSFLIIFLMAGDVTETQAGQYAWTTAKSGLRMRDKPALNGKKIGTIPYNTRVTVIEEKGPEKVIAGKRGKWAKVKGAGLTGWVFGGFLTTKEPLSLKQTAERFKEIMHVEMLSFDEYIDKSGFELEFYRYGRADGTTKGKKRIVGKSDLSGTIKIPVVNDGKGWDPPPNVKEKKYIMNFNFYSEVANMGSEYSTQVDEKKQTITFSNEQYSLTFHLKKVNHTYKIKKIEFNDQDPG